MGLGVRIVRFGAKFLALSVGLISVVSVFAVVPAAQAAQTPPPWTCGFLNGLEPANPPAQLHAGHIDIFGTRLVAVGDHIDWNQNSNLTIRLNLQSLKWLEPLLTSGTADDLALAQSIIQQWAVDNPADAPADPYGWTEHAVGLRATTLACMREVVGSQVWLDTIIAQHVSWLADDHHYAGAWNQGLTEDVGLVGAACSIGDLTGIAHGQARAQASVAVVVDAQGLVNDQAVRYQNYVFQILIGLRYALLACSPTELPTVFNRVDLMPAVTAQMVQPDGSFCALGDTDGTPSDSDRSPMDYVTSFGTVGTPPLTRYGVYPGGFAFAHSGWGLTRDFGSEDLLTLRFGPGRIIHGHNDHTSITTFGRGQPLLVDSGFGGYDSGAMRDYLRSAQAHNMTVVPGLTYRWAQTTTLVAQRITSVDETFVVSDSPYSGVSRRRTVFASHDVPVTVVVDHSSSTTTRTFNQLWHISPNFSVKATSAYGVRYLSKSGGTSLSVSAIPWPGRTRARISTTSGQTNPYQGWVAAHSVMVPAPVTTFASVGRSQQQVMLSISSRPGAKISWTMKPFGRSVNQLRVRIDGRPITLNISASGWISRL